MTHHNQTKELTTWLLNMEDVDMEVDPQAYHGPFKRWTDDSYQRLTRFVLMNMKRILLHRNFGLRYIMMPFIVT
jgi:hypothetical protein